MFKSEMHNVHYTCNYRCFLTQSISLQPLQDQWDQEKLYTFKVTVAIFEDVYMFTQVYMYVLN